MFRATGTRMATALLFLVASVGCSAFMKNFKANLDGDPIGNWQVRAARVPATSRPCVAKCKQRDDACFQHLQAPGMTGNAQEQEVCLEAKYKCYAACPNATEKTVRYQQVPLSEAMRRACAEGLAAGQKVFCMTRNGVIGQAFDPE